MIDGLRPVYAKERERQEREAKKANWSIDWSYRDAQKDLA